MSNQNETPAEKEARLSLKRLAYRKIITNETPE
jgi:hypothetical protein